MLYILNEIILAASALLNIIGLIFVYNLKKRYANQRILLGSFSSSELYFTLSKFITLILIQTVGPDSIYRVVVETIGRAGLVVYYLMMILLLLDRFTACIFPVLHRSSFSKDQAKIACIMTWVIGLSTAIICPFIGFQEFQEKTQLAYLGFCITFLSSSSFVYIVIGFKLRYRMPSSRSTVNHRLTRVAFLIGLTFLVFIAIPEITVFIILKEDEDTLSNFWARLLYVVGNINFCIDPLIYVFGYQPVKAVFRQKVFKRPTCDSPEYSVHACLKEDQVALGLGLPCEARQRHRVFMRKMILERVSVTSRA